LNKFNFLNFNRLFPFVPADLKNSLSGKKDRKIALEIPYFLMLDFGTNFAYIF